MRFLRLPLLTLAFVALGAPAVEHAAADFDAAKSAMANKVAEELVATPIQLAWKDIYQAFVQGGGSRLLRRLHYSLAGVLGEKEAVSLTKFIMKKIKDEVFEGKVNEKAWLKLEIELYNLLRQWWRSTPEHPGENAEFGVWQALIALQKDALGPSLRGSNRVDHVNEVLLDPELTTIKSWVAEWRQNKEAAKEKSD